MRRTAFMTAMLVFASLSSISIAQDKDVKKDAPAAPAAATAPSKHLPQAKTQPEFDAYKVVMSSPTPEATEKAADDFAAKFPDSEIRILLYKQAMRLYQNTNNADKTADVGRK